MQISLKVLVTRFGEQRVKPAALVKRYGIRPGGCRFQHHLEALEITGTIDQIFKNSGSDAAAAALSGNRDGRPAAHVMRDAPCSRTNRHTT